MTPADEVAAGLERARQALCPEDVAVPDLQGKLLRPLVAWALVPAERRADLDEGFWCGALAIQMVHEASLLHDDILDGAEVRRGIGTAAAEAGVGRALLLGDLYLTGAYRAAAASGQPVFLEHFIRAVERTVSGEAAQARQSGLRMRPESYEGVISDKSGALFGAAAALAATTAPAGSRYPASSVDPERSIDAWVDFGRRLGSMYQRIDDLLDYCPGFDTGKPPLQDYRQGKWTWVLDLIDGVDDFSLDAGEVVLRLFATGGRGASPAADALAALRRERRDLLERVRALCPEDTVVAGMLDAWLEHAAEAVGRQEMVHERRVRSATEEVRRQANALGGPDRWRAYFGEHAKTFRLASRLFPDAPAEKVSGIYAFCRFTDDLVDDPPADVEPQEVRARLAAWRALTEAALDGQQTGIPVLDHVIADAARSGVSRRYPMALLDGVAMDLDRMRYNSWNDLEAYTFGVAGSVGGWLTQAFGIHDPMLLERAHDLGHAMQLTNIARDVGEDLGLGRLYLPLELLADHGLEPEALLSLRAGSGPLPEAYIEVVEALVARADTYYERAWPAIGALPAWYRRPVAAAAAAYRGIHDEIRANGHDNLRSRAHTSTVKKVALAAAGMARARKIPAAPVRLQGAVQ